MHGCPHGHLDGLQIESAGLALFPKDKPQQAAYFSFDFLRIVSAVVFLFRERVFHRLCAADSLVDFQQFTAQFPKTVKGFDLVLRLAQFGGGGEGFTYRFPIHFACQPEVGTVAQLVWLQSPPMQDEPERVVRFQYKMSL